MTTFTVLIPTFNNCQSLRYSIPSVLNQDFGDFELFVVGDGCPPESKEIIQEFARQDERVVFFDNPKGPRHGEVYRHAAMQQARGKYVCYLSDDDLLLPQHLSVVLRSFQQGFEFVHALPVHVMPDDVEPPDGSIEIPELNGKRIVVLKGSLDLSESVECIRGGHNFLSLSSVSHSLDLYRKLPYGWRTTPEGIFTDLYMWLQFIELPEFKATNTRHATVIHCAKGIRTEWTPQARLEEIAEWSALLGRAELGPLIDNAAFSVCLAWVVELTSREQKLCHQNDQLHVDLRNTQCLVDSLQTLIEETDVAIKAKDASITENNVAIKERDAALEQARHKLDSMYASLTWRAAERLRSYKLLKSVGRTIASYLSR